MEYPLLYLLFFFATALATGGSLLLINSRRVRVEIETEYSRALVVDEDERRALYFYKRNGGKALESAMHLKDPIRLMLPYSGVMLFGNVIAENPRNALLIGLGGGSMVKYIGKKIPELQLDVVEIDSQIHNIAQKYFLLPEKPGINIYIEDAFDYLGKSSMLYDLIYVDAFLNSADHTDEMGVPLNLKTKDFYYLLNSALHADGAVAFNLNRSSDTNEDIRMIHTNFSNVYKFTVPERSNIVVVATNQPRRWSREQLVERAARYGAEKFPENLPAIKIGELLY